jgi:hypothetical protein
LLLLVWAATNYGQLGTATVLPSMSEAWKRWTVVLVIFAVHVIVFGGEVLTFRLALNDSTPRLIKFGARKMRWSGESLDAIAFSAIIFFVAGIGVTLAALVPFVAAFALAFAVAVPFAIPFAFSFANSLSRKDYDTIAFATSTAVSFAFTFAFAIAVFSSVTSAGVGFSAFAVAILVFAITILVFLHQLQWRIRVFTERAPFMLLSVFTVMVLYAAVFALATEGLPRLPQWA